MTKHTQRDKLRAAIHDAADEAASSSSYGNRFDKSDVRERLDFAPSDRSIRDTMNTMVEQGFINESTWQGDFEPGEVTVAAAFPLFFEGDDDETANEVFQEQHGQLQQEHGFEVLEAHEVDDGTLLAETLGEFEVQKGESPTEEVTKQVRNKIVGHGGPDAADVSIQSIL